MSRKAFLRCIPTALLPADAQHLDPRNREGRGPVPVILPCPSPKPSAAFSCYSEKEAGQNRTMSEACAESTEVILGICMRLPTKLRGEYVYVLRSIQGRDGKSERENRFHVIQPQGVVRGGSHVGSLCVYQ
ncbi:hypothetical protein FOTG_18793 [Fusarium oxysporum f. sp. vasinfectum 25433]|uniref:Uncharacterized protein n=1 Tax=Fusarium oxysporum f. sp. vasinfectum 25433 TaxID=1089449 RepID=X0KVL0_FUSOX|nr:hypothetical protein FOTG_18793 [Fusarium oxysporum f. sp. vasinfectum 25433]